ncbi:SDR family NAD(P)-dependent oxidoreductase [Kitasatospora sp. NPDC015120]|uniref:SDR family NAD(P)-dependent oxidoreductase n=1 Tax=Kitasatospora sp. NPDC015120 TaxID=3364023 RepID=UPI0036F454AE
MPKVWFITGSSRGLGRAIAETALSSGDRVVATARRPEQLSDLVDQYGENVIPVALDVTDAAAAESAVATAVERFGRIDVVVNNAGYGDIAAIEDVTIEDFTAQINTLLMGTVYVTKAVLPTLREQGSGHIFQVSSVGGRITLPGLAAYQAAKWGVGGFSGVLAQEIAPFGVKVTVLEPGGMRTDWAGSSMTIPPISEPYQQTVGAIAGMLRAGTGSEPNDPAKIGALIQQILELPEPPVRLLVGSDAFQYATAAAEALAESDARWHELSESVAFDEN